MNMNDYFNPVFEALATHLERTKDDNDSRYEYWRHLSSRDWANREFEDLVWGCLDFIAFEVANAKSRTNVENIAPEAVEQWVVLNLSAWILGSREMSSSLDRSTLNNVKAAAQELDNVFRDIEDMKRIDTRGGGRDRDRNDRSRDDRNRVDRSAPRGMVGRGREETKRPASGMSAAIEARNRNDREERPARTAREDRDTRNREGVDDQSDSSPRSTGGRLPAKSEKSTMEGIDFTLAKPYDSFIIQGEEWKPSHKCNWTLTPEHNHLVAFPTAFNPRKQMRFYVFDKNEVVREELKDMNRDMEYLRHELGRTGTHRARKTDPAKPERAPLESPGYIAPGTIPDESILVQRAAQAGVQMFSKNTNIVSSREEGEMIAQFEQLRLAHQTTVFNFMVNTPIVVTTTVGLELLRDIGLSINLTDAAQKMKECIDMVDGGVWEYVNSRMTKLINGVTRNHYGLVADIDDFANDYEDLIKWMKAKNETVARSFSQYTSYIPAAAVLEFDDDSRKNWLMGALDLTEDEFIARDPAVLCFDTPYSVAMVNFTLGDLGLRPTKESQAIDPLNNEYFYTLLVKILDCNESAVLGGQSYILTRDRFRLEIIKSPSDKDVILMRLMKD